MSDFGGSSACCVLYGVVEVVSPLLHVLRCWPAANAHVVVLMQKNLGIKLHEYARLSLMRKKLVMLPLCKDR